MSAHRNSSLVFPSIVGAMLVAGLLAGALAQAQTFTVISDIPAIAGVENPGAQKIVQGRNGDLYSTGQGGEGTAVYSLSIAGIDTKVVDTGNRGNGGGVTLGTDGNFYGTSDLNGTVNNCGGLYNCGIVWKTTPSGVLTTVYNFEGPPDGCDAVTAPVQAPSGLFYGTTPTCSGGSNYGVIYSLTSTGTYKVLHTFSGSDGAYPHATLTVGSDGNLYGGTSQGGNNNNGVLFRMTPSGAYTVLHYFAGSDGFDVESGMIVAGDGNLYGTTNRGGDSGVGVIFKLTTSGIYTVINPLNQSPTGPTTSLVQGTDGKFYGILGPGASGNNGVIYSVTTTGTLTRLHSFCQQKNCTDGYGPSTPLVQDTDGKFYGVTSTGGTPNQCNSGIGCGVFYSLSMGLAPFINLSTYAGNIGSTVGIFGQGFDSASVVKFNGVNATKIVLSGTAYITATVPAGATDGRVTVTTGTTTLSSTKNFIVHNTWSKGKAMPIAVQRATAAVLEGQIYVVGGENTSGSAVADVQIYNPSTNTWSTGSALPAVTQDSSSAVVNNILYIFGGDNGVAAPTNAVWAYNPATKKWTGKSAMLTARNGMLAVVENNIVYLIGGNLGGGPNFVATVESYNPATNTWKTEASMDGAKDFPGGGLIGTTIVAADGAPAGSVVTGDTEGYNAVTNKWTELKADPTARTGPCSGVINGILYDVSGYINNAGAATTVNESFNLSTNTWTTTLAKIPQGTMYLASTVANGQLYCFGGTAVVNSTAIGNVQIYQP